MALKTGALAAGFLQMAFRAVVHFHGLAVVFTGFAQPGDTVSPDVPAVSGNDVFLVYFGMGGVSDIPVAGLATHTRARDMGGMREEDAVRLPEVAEPFHFLVLLDIFRDEFFFFRVRPHDVLVTVRAGGKIRNPGETAVFAKIMAGIASIGNIVHMNRMIKINGLVFFGIEPLGEEKPSDNQAADQPDHETKEDNPPGRWFRRMIGRIRGRFQRMVDFWGVHENSIQSVVELIKRFESFQNRFQTSYRCGKMKSIHKKKIKYLFWSGLSKKIKKPSIKAFQ
jgi:hypothetical protein